MNVLLKNWLLQNRGVNKRHCKLLFLAMFFYSIGFSQIANYVTNGGFELTYNNCNFPNYTNIAKSWSNIDSSAYAGNYCSKCINLSNVPYNGNTFQYPKSGDAYVIVGFLCKPPSCTPPPNRGYLKNRLRQKLKLGVTYCVSFYASITNASSYGMDGFGIYFGDNQIDTITKCTIPLTYINPQIQNQNNNIITDTLNWVLINGIYTANGNEKYMLIGNFKSDFSTNTSLINPTNLPAVFTDVCIDDVSCIPIDLPAYAGHDTMCIPGTSVYIGRQRDVGIDEACMWYKLPIVITPTTPGIDTAAGIWVNPIATSTYVVRQEICGNVRWDTVIVYQTAVGLAPLSLGEGLGVRLYPNPANDNLTITATIDNGSYEITIYNAFGQLLREEEIVFKNKTASIKTDELANGVYVLKLSDKTQTVSKRFVINH